MRRAVASFSSRGGSLAVGALGAALGAALRRHSRQLTAAAAEPAWVQAYRDDGVALVPGFASDETTDTMIASMAELIEAWDPETSRNSVFHVNSAEGAAADADGEAAGLARDLYFFDTADENGFFLNPGAIEGDDIRRDMPKAHLLNKVGHGACPSACMGWGGVGWGLTRTLCCPALHLHVPAFRECKLAHRPLPTSAPSHSTLLPSPSNKPKTAR